MIVSDIVRHGGLSVHEHTDLPVAADLLVACGLGTLPVADHAGRLVGVVIDWTLCQLVAAALFSVPLPFTELATGRDSAVLLAVFAVENLLLVGTLGSTIGHRVVGLQVRSMDGRGVRPVQAIVRTALLCLFLPAMFWDRDGRGLHDKAAGTLIART